MHYSILSLTIVAIYSSSVESAGIPMPSLGMFGQSLPCLGSISLFPGTCQSSSNCQSNGGFTESSLSCLNNLQCCISPVTCDAETSVNDVVFANPGYPNPSSDAKMCTLRVNKILLQDVQQIRLDIITMNLIKPDANGCTNDALTITGIRNENEIPRICGDSSGQHMYIPVNGLSGPFNINIGTSGANFGRKWAIRVTQLTGTDQLAPRGCLQYYTDITSSFESFNNGYSMIGGVNYGICVKVQNGYCGVTYYPRQFNLSPKTGNDCTGDYIRFPPSETGNQPQCGNDFNGGNSWVASKGGPQIIYVGAKGQHHGTGFKFDYSLNICPF